MSEPTTLAREWQDWYTHCYDGLGVDAGELRERRLGFYTGWYCAIRAMAGIRVLATEDPEAARAVVVGWNLEFDAYVHRYLKERQEERRDE